jgi:hypothetical protein
MHSILKPLQSEFVKSLEHGTGSKSHPKQPESAGGKQASSSLVLTEEQAYHNEIFEYTSNLTQAVERLEEMPYYLAQFPNTKTFQKQGITLHKWIQYHYSSFLITGVSIYDTALLLTNAVFRLGLHPRDCSERTVTKNQNVRRTPVRVTLKSLDAVTKKYREPRNLYVHRSRKPGLEFLDRLDGLRFIQESSEGLNIEAGDPEIHPVIRKELYKLERRKLIEAVRNETAAISDSVERVFDALQPIYQAYTSSFRGKRAN